MAFFVKEILTPVNHEENKQDPPTRIETLKAEKQEPSNSIDAQNTEVPKTAAPQNKSWYEETK